MTSQNRSVWKKKKTKIEYNKIENLSIFTQICRSKHANCYAKQILEHNEWKSSRISIMPWNSRTTIRSAADRQFNPRFRGKKFENFKIFEDQKRTLQKTD